MGGRRADRHRRRRERRRCPGKRDAGRRRARQRTSRSRHVESALARIPARAGGAHRPGRCRGRQFLDVAAGDVHVSRPRRRRRLRGDRRAGVCRDAEGGLHGGRRVSLCASRSRRPRVRGSGGARAARYRRGSGRRHCLDAAAGVLRARRIRGNGARRNTAPLRLVHRFVRASRRRPGARRPCAARNARYSAAQPARGHAGRACRGSSRWSPRRRRSTSMPPSRSARSPTASPGSAPGRSSGCSIMPISMAAGASSMRRT